MEIWKDIIGYKGLYKVSNLGNIKSLDREVVYSNGTIRIHKGKIRKPSILEYRMISLSRNGKIKMYKISRIVAFHFLNKDKNRNVVNHKDHNKHNDHVDNLEWVTYSENSIHSSLIRNAKNKTIGIFYDKKRNKWTAYVYRNNKNIFVGRFESKELAIFNRELKLKDFEQNKY